MDVFINRLVPCGQLIYENVSKIKKKIELSTLVSNNLMSILIRKYLLNSAEEENNLGGSFQTALLSVFLATEHCLALKLLE